MNTSVNNSSNLHNAQSQIVGLASKLNKLSKAEFFNQIEVIINNYFGAEEPAHTIQTKDFYEDSPVMQLVIDQNAFIRSINDEFASFLGVFEDDAKGLTIYEFLHEDYRERFYFFIQNLIKYKKNNTQIAIRTKKQSSAVLSVFGKLIDSGNLLLILFDITEIQKKYDDSRYTSQMLEQRIDEQLSQLVNEIEIRKQSELAAKTNELFLRKIANALPEAVYVQDFSEQKIFFFNNAFSKALNYATDDDNSIRFEEFFDLIHPDDLKMEINFLDRIQALPEGQPLESVIRVRKSDGSYIWAFNKEVVFSRNEKGEITQVLGISENITSKHISDLEMQSMQDIMEQFFSKSTHGFFFMMLDKPIDWNDAINKEEVIEYVFDHQTISKTNIALLNLYSTSSSQLIGSTPRMLFAHDIESGKRFWIELFDKGHTHSIIEERDFNGNTIWIEGDYLCMYNSDGQLIGHFGIQHDVTEKKATEDELQRSEEKFRSLANHLQVGIYRSTPDGSIQLVNQQFLQIFDFDSFEEVINTSALDFYNNPDDRAKNLEIFSHGDISKIEVEMITRKGRKITVIDTSIAIRNEKGEPEYFDGVIEDVTSLRNIQNSYAEINTKFQNLAENIPDVIIRIDENLCIQFANPAITKYFGLSPDEIIGKNITDIDVCDEFSDISEIVVKDVIASKTPNQLSFSSLTENGSFAFELRLIPELSKEGDLFSVLAIIRDITTQMKVEEILRYESNLLRSLSDAVISTDLDLNIISWNKSAEQIYGWTEKEVCGRCLQDLLNTQFINDTPINAEKTVLANRVWKGELLQFDKFGNEVNIIGTSNLLDGPNGSTKGLVLVNHDITELKKAEKQLMKLNAELEQRVQERTDDLNKALEEIKNRNIQLQDLNKSIAEDSLKLLQLNSRLTDSESNLLELTKELDYRVQERTRELLEAKTKAEEAMKLKAIILDNLGHELRTPLNGILGFTQVLKEANEDENLDEMIEMISLSSNRLKNTLNALLALTELEARRIVVSLQPLSLKEFIERFVFSFEHVGAKRQVPVEIRILDEKPFALVDEYMLEQICFNLLDNAFKFTDEGKITIEVDTDNDGTDARSIIRFIDTGIGIAPEKQSYVFEAFAQESEGISRSHEGVGVGLTITKKMVEMMDGTITLESTIGQGSIFSVNFPFFKDYETLFSYE